MNRSGVRQKRSLGKSSPLSKRPKLDFTPKSKSSCSDNKEFPNASPGSYEKVEKNALPSVSSFENKLNGNFLTEPDWDDEFSGDMLEKVCLIADLSQAMVSNQTVQKKVVPTKTHVSEESKVSHKIIELETIHSNDEIKKLKLDLSELQEKFKTKEGEVHILRSQLKQNEETKQTAALHSIKTIDEIHKKYSEKLNLTERELETYKTKLQFKDMEYKTLSDRCRQLEYCISKSKLSDAGASQSDLFKPINNLSQVIPTKGQNKEVDQDLNIITNIDKPSLEIFKDEFNGFYHHEGKYLEKSLCPEIFQLIEEPSVSQFYAFRSEINCNKSKLDFGKEEKCKSFDIPKQTAFLRDLYSMISSLFGYETFNQKRPREIVEKILDYCEKILMHTKKVLLFLKDLQLQNYEYLDESLLENEDEVEKLTLKNLLEGKRYSTEECSIEGRRTLALVYALMITSQVATNYVKKKAEFLGDLKILVSTIGSLRTPLRYTGILVGVSFVLQRLLLEENLDKANLLLINDIVEEIIFSRPKLDVLIEVVNVLSAGKNHIEFLSRLCRKASLDSCSLYVDSKLKQAMFFTKNACALKLLCMQITGLACLPSSNKIKWELTDSVIRWLNNSLNTAKFKTLRWLPVNFLVNDEEKCFDVTDSLLYLLTLCLRDYLEKYSHQDEEDWVEFSPKKDNGKKNLISIIGHGAVLLKRILKTDQRQLHDNSNSVRFVGLLNSLMLEKCDISEKHFLNVMQMQAIKWLTDSLEGDSRNQDLKQSTSAISDIDIFSALKIVDESKIF